MCRWCHKSVANPSGPLILLLVFLFPLLFLLLPLHGARLVSAFKPRKIKRRRKRKIS
jgi:hypothetical protein